MPRAQAAIAMLAGLVFAGAAHAGGKPPADVIAASARCILQPLNEAYVVEFSPGAASLTVTGKRDGKEVVVKDTIGAIVDMGGTTLVVVPPSSNSQITSVYFFGATTKAAFYLKGGVFEHEDKCKLISSETQP